ncbi:MAG: hypothetical protein EOO27_03675 [Comamonadaceae bacterium]|nr:MAG: hypothetical protein EOO27_03675 [Comamonadaceae bacterium]
MLAHNHTAVIARNEIWAAGPAQTEPYEAGWAREAIVFLTSLRAAGLAAGNQAARVQMSPDGMRWADEGTTLDIPIQANGVSMARLRHFGNWLRVVADVPAGGEAAVVVTLHLK